MYSPASIDALREGLDIVTLIQTYTPLKKKGKYWWGLSPFKAEKTASFAVDDTKGTWRDFSTGKGGDAFAFLMEKEGMNFREALEKAASVAGITLAEEGNAQAKDDKTALRAAMAAAVQFYQLREVSTAWRSFFRERGITEQDITVRRLGIAGSEWSALSDFLQRNGHGQETIIAAGLATRSQKTAQLVDRYRDRLIFPINDHLGHTVALGGRLLPGDTVQQGKYINSPEGELYKKGRVLYGLDMARKAIQEAGFAYLVEGYTDVISLCREGIENVVGTCGTALTEAQVKLLRRFTASVVLCFDGDEAGQTAINRALPLLLAEDMQVKIIRIPGGADPDDYARNEGGEAFRNLPQLDWLADWCGQQPKTTTPAEVATQAQQALDMIALLPTEMEQELYISDLATRMGLRSEALAAQLRGESSLDSLAAAAEVQAADPIAARDLATWKTLMETFELKSEKNFERSGAALLSAYLDGGMRGFIPQGSAGAIVPVGQQVQGPWLPFEIAESLHNGEKYSTIYLAEDAITAALLTQAGLPVIGMSWREAVMARRNGKALHTVMKGLLRQAEVRHVIYLAPGEAFQLPALPRPMHGKDNPYAERDASEIATDWVDLMVGLKEAFSGYNLHMIWPAARAWRGVDNWPERMLIDNRAAMLRGEESRNLWETISNDIRRVRLDGNPDDTGMFSSLCLSDYSADKYREVLHVDTAQRFFDFHGYDKLGARFQFGRHCYDVDRDGRVKLDSESVDDTPVYKKDGQYFARRKGGVERISDFSLNPSLKIHGTKPYVLCTVVDKYSTKYEVVLPPEPLADAQRFYLLIYGLTDCFWHGSSADLKRVYELEFKRMKAAYMVESLGHVDLRPNAEKRVSFYALGNGVIDYSRGFIPCDSKGLLKLDGQILFLPAESEYQISDTRDLDYDAHRKMSYRAGSNTLSFGDWMKKMVSVHGLLQSHVAVSFAVMSLYRTEIVKVTPKVPLLFLQGETGSGKSTLRESISALWGQAPLIQVNGKPSVAATGSLPRQVTDGVVFLEEFNVFKMVQEGNDWIIDLAKASYDGLTRATRSGPHTESLRNKPVTAAIVCLGQEAFYQYDEAVNNRFCVLEFPDRDKDKEAYDALKSVESLGVMHITEFLLMKRPLIAEHYRQVQIEVEAGIKHHELLKGLRVLDRLVQNWSVALTPILILIRQGVIDYPLSFKAIIDLAAASVRDHVTKAQKHGIMGEFWSFISTAYGRTIDDRYIFEWNREGHERELRLRFAEVYELFIRYLKEKGDRTIQAPTKGNLLNKLRSLKAYRGEGKTYMGYKRNDNQNIIFRADEDGQSSRPVYAEKHCIRIAICDLGEERTDAVPIQLTEIEVSQHLPELAVAAAMAVPPVSAHDIVLVEQTKLPF